MPAPTIYYIRHGETAWNATGRLQGTQDVPLNELGRKQAAHAGNVLAGLFARDGRGRNDLSYVASPLGRARSTIACARSVTASGKARRWPRCRQRIPSSTPGA